MNPKIYIVIIVIICVFFIGGIVAQQYLTSKPTEMFKVIQTIPGGSQGGFVEQDKIVPSPLGKVSVVFNRDIDESTLTTDAFYALWGINDKVPSIIQYEKNNRTASLIFNQDIVKNPNQGIITITVVVNGIKDLTGQEIEGLTYNININD